MIQSINSKTFKKTPVFNEYTNYNTDNYQEFAEHFNQNSIIENINKSITEIFDITCCQEILSFFPELFFATSFCIYLFFFSIFSSYRCSLFNKKPTLLNNSFCISIQIMSLFIIICFYNTEKYKSIFIGTITYDIVSKYSKISIVILSIFILIMSYKYLKTNLILNFEFFIIYLLNCFSIIVIVSCSDLITFYLCLELQGLSSYLIANFKKNSSFSSEASIKFFIIGTFSSGLFLYGSSVLYGFFGTTNYYILKDLLLNYNYDYSDFFIFFGFLCVCSSFFFKLGIAPFHIWIPDIYEGSPYIVSFFFSIVPKIAFFISLLKFINTGYFNIINWYTIFYIIGIISLIISSVGSINQKRLKRFLVFSSIGHMGFIILSISFHSEIGYVSILNYLCIYILISFCFWGSFIGYYNTKNINVKYIDQLEHSFKENKILTFIQVLTLFSIAGVPPQSGFFAKFHIFFFLINSNYYLTCFLIIIFSTVTAYYYLKFIKIIIFVNAEKTSNKYRSKFLYTNFTKVEAYLITTFFFFSFLFFFNNNLISIIIIKTTTTLFYLKPL